MIIGDWVRRNFEFMCGVLQNNFQLMSGGSQLEGKITSCGQEVLIQVIQ